MLGVGSWHCQTWPGFSGNLHCVVSILPVDSSIFRREHLSCNDCQEDTMEDYHNCFVLYCVLQFCTLWHSLSTLMNSSYNQTMAWWLRLYFVCVFFACFSWTGCICHRFVFVKFYEGMRNLFFGTPTPTLGLIVWDTDNALKDD